MVTFSSKVVNIGSASNFDTKQLNEVTCSFIASNENFKLIQLWRPISYEEASILNTFIFSKRKDISLNIMGIPHLYEYDLSFLSYMPEVTQLWITNMSCIINGEAIKDLHNLTKIVLDLKKQKEYTFIESISTSLEIFCAYIPNKNAEFDISLLLNFPQLHSVLIGTWNKGLEKLTTLPSVHSLVLRSVLLNDYTFINQMKNLKKLSLQLGKVSDYSALCGNKQITTIELWCIAKLEDLSFCATLPNLKNLSLHQLKNVTSIPSAKWRHLETLRLDDMTGLTNFTALEVAPRLKLVYSSSKKTVPAEAFIPILKNKNLCHFFHSSPSTKENKKLDAYVVQYMKKDNIHPLWKKFEIDFFLWGV